MNLQADVVKKGYLKFKTAKPKGTPGASVQALAVSCSARYDYSLGLYCLSMGVNGHTVSSTH